MILITKQEAEVVRLKYPDADIVRTCVHKSNRHRYYMPERLSFLRLIRKTNREAAKILDERNKQQKNFTKNGKSDIRRG